MSNRARFAGNTMGLAVVITVLVVSFLPLPAQAKTITEIIDATGDGGGNILDQPADSAVDGSGNVYVTGLGSDNAFKIDPNGVITEIIDATGDGGGNILGSAAGVAVGSGNVYVVGQVPATVFQIDPRPSSYAHLSPDHMRAVADLTLRRPKAGSVRLSAKAVGSGLRPLHHVGLHKYCTFLLAAAPPSSILRRITPHLPLPGVGSRLVQA